MVLINKTERLMVNAENNQGAKAKREREQAGECKKDSKRTLLIAHLCEIQRGQERLRRAPEKERDRGRERECVLKWLYFSLPI